jgi:hypothetical protein
MRFQASTLIQTQPIKALAQAVARLLGMVDLLVTRRAEEALVDTVVPEGKAQARLGLAEAAPQMVRRVHLAAVVAAEKGVTCPKFALVTEVEHTCTV